MTSISIDSRSVLHDIDTRRIEDAVRDNAWLHFTQMADFQNPEKRPLMIVRGEGITLWDLDGNAHLDLLAGIYSVNAGYGRQRIVHAMSAQASQLPYVNPFGYISVPAAVLAERLADLAPLGGEARVFFTSGGSEAVESALELAKQYHTIHGYPHRWKTVSRRVAYHGATMGALSVNGLTDARAPFGPLVSGTRHAPMSHRHRCPYCQDARPAPVPVTTRSNAWLSSKGRIRWRRSFSSRCRTRADASLLARWTISRRSERCATTPAS